ncbi:hypothetical protein IW01_13155 [Pectobacterium brasiliense]|uniref:hypothetical protein n=1 Tax=Pectobacterium brasiliense TaxID=180957 RepID=UPI0004E6E350|nr:hypothetical protein [Pectobacterium brasiliense]KFF69073.1 hypothetical protein IW01_13155 [Pectobacterium brasiliense]
MIFADPVGNYIDKNGLYSLVITEAASHVGRFKGTFTVKDTPEGEIQYIIGDTDLAIYAYTENKNIAGISFIGFERPDDWRFVLLDSWAGSIKSNGDLLMSGSRSYTKLDGTCQVFSFNNITLTKK